MPSNYSATQADVVLAAALKTALEIATPATNAASLYHFWVDFDGISASAVPVLLEIVYATASIGGTTLTPTRVGGLGPTTANVTAKHTAASGSGTNLGGVAWKRRVSPTTGFDIYLPDNRLIEVGVSSFLRMNITPGAAVNATVGFEWQE
jgi:hypothetical protein